MRWRMSSEDLRPLNATLIRVRNQIDPAAVNRPIGILRRSKIEFYGWQSGITAEDAQHKFFRSGCTTVAYSDRTSTESAATC